MFEHLGALSQKSKGVTLTKQERKNEQETSDLYNRRSQTKNR